MLVPEAVQVDLRGERACFLPVFRDVSILDIGVPDPDFRGFPLQRVIASAKFRGIHEHAQNLHVVFGGDAGDDDTHDEEPIPPTSECMSEKIAPPVISATKNSRRSAPRMVSGRFIAL